MKIRNFIFYPYLFFLVACSLNGKAENSYKPGEVMVARISSDGNYVVTGGDQNSILLWHIPTRTYQVISKDGNGFSPYFIKNSHEFLWQSNKDNVIHVETIDGKEVMKIPSKHKIYSDTMTSDKHYFFMSDFDWLKYRYDTKTKKWKRFSVSAFGGDEKPLNMTINHNDQYLLTSGTCYQKWDDISLGKPKALLNLDCVVLWDIARAKPIRKFWGNRGVTIAALSPKGNVVVSGDETGDVYVSNARQKVRLDDIYFGEFLRIAHTGDVAKDYKWDSDGITQPPKAYANGAAQGSDYVFSLKFITHSQYLRINNETFFAALYGTMSRKPKKYLNMGKMPWPSTVDYSRDGSIDTSIKTHTLVTGQASFDGINVYKFDPKTETLYRVWSPILNKPETAPKKLSKDVPTLPGITFDQLSEVKRVDSYPKK